MEKVQKPRGTKTGSKRGSYKKEFVYIAFNTYVTPEQRESLHKIANRKKLKLAELVRLMIDDFVARQNA